jgi:hypothetical protein
MKGEDIKVGQRVWFRDPRYDEDRGRLYNGADGADIQDDFVRLVDHQHGHESCCLMERTSVWVFASRLYPTWEEAFASDFPSVPASNLIGTIQANVDNKAMTDREFRQFVRNSLPLVRELALKESHG